jgi:hypothetical protein
MRYNFLFRTDLTHPTPVSWLQYVQKPGKMPTSQQEAMSQVSEATLISITCRIKQHEIMTSEDLIRRAQLWKALETFSANNDGFPSQYGLGEEDAELLTDFKVCFEWVGDDKEEIGKSEEWVCCSNDKAFPEDR